MKIFISHSSNDIPIAKSLIDLLRSAFNLPADEIRCTSVNGYRLPIGVKPEEKLRQEIFECDILLGLLTPSSLSSHYVLFEMGARWGKNLTIFPLLCSEGCINLVSGPLSGINALDACDIHQVHQLITDISNKLTLRTERPEVYSENAEKFAAQAKKIGATNISKEEKNNNHIIQALNNTKINLKGTDFSLSEIFLTASPDLGYGAFRDDISRSLIKLFSNKTDGNVFTSSDENTDIIGELMILDLITERNVPNIKHPKYYLTDLGKTVLKEIKTTT
jgi:hypothetical protein